MKRLLSAVLVIGVGTLFSSAQTIGNQHLQTHGFATQAFALSNDNNYLSMDTRSGSFGWTEAAVNVNDSISDKLRAGIQLHYTRLGDFGGDKVAIDWALGEYKPKDWLGVRAGKVKIRWGLYNDTQDYDPGYLWSLLPEPIYAVDWRSTDLSQLGAELFGNVSLSRSLGDLSYSAYYGVYHDASDDGVMQDYKEGGTTFNSPPGGKTPGFDLRWKTPVRGLTVGGSLMIFNAKGTLANGKFNQPPAFWSANYAQYDFRKLFLSGQYSKAVEYDISTLTGSAPSVDHSDSRAWFAMAGYHLTDKLQAGTYYTHFVDAAAGDNSDPANYFRDWVASGRFDFNFHFYGKLEGHFINGNGVGFYGFNNPNDLKPQTKVLVAKVGFTF